MKFYAAIVLLAGVVALPNAAAAQSQPSRDQFAHAILALPATFGADQRVIAGARLFGGSIEAVIRNFAGDAQDFQDPDRITFRVTPRVARPGMPTGPGFTEDLVGTRAEFEGWAQDHAAELLKVFFPEGLSSGLAGRDTSTLYSQQLVLTTVLGAEDEQSRIRDGVPGLFEAESLRRKQRDPGDSLWALQGLVGITKHLAIQGRYGRQQEVRSLGTSTTSLAVDYHPFIERTGMATIRVGATARAGFTYTRLDSLDLGQSEDLRFGAMDFSGGGWVGVRKTVSRFKLGGGALVQGTKNYLPEGNENTFRHAIAKALNERGLQYDVTLGATARVSLWSRTDALVHYTDTRALESSVDRSPAHMVMAGLAYAFAPGRALNAGYRFTDLSGARAHAITLQGNFGW